MHLTSLAANTFINTCTHMKTSYLLSLTTSVCCKSLFLYNLHKFQTALRSPTIKHITTEREFLTVYTCTELYNLFNLQKSPDIQDYLLWQKWRTSVKNKEYHISAWITYIWKHCYNEREWAHSTLQVTLQSTAARLHQLTFGVTRFCTYKHPLAKNTTWMFNSN